MTLDNALRRLAKIALFVVALDILIITCCYADAPSDEPMTYLPQAVPEAGYLAGCPTPGKWAVSTWSGPTTETHTAIATCYPTTIDAVYYLDPMTNGWTSWFRDRPEISTLHEVRHMQGLITYASPTLAQIHDEPAVYWPTLLDGEITIRSEGTLQTEDGLINLAAWVEETIEEGWQIEATHNGLDFDVDLQITVHDDLMYEEGRACGLAGMNYATHVCHVSLSLWCFDQDFIWDDVPEMTLLHEVGHCMGLAHRDEGVMGTGVAEGCAEA